MTVEIPGHQIGIAIALALGPASQIDGRTKAVRQRRRGRDRPRHSRAAFALRAVRAADNHGSQALGKSGRGPHSAGPLTGMTLNAAMAVFMSAFANIICLHEGPNFLFSLRPYTTLITETGNKL